MAATSGNCGWTTCSATPRRCGWTKTGRLWGAGPQARRVTPISGGQYVGLVRVRADVGGRRGRRRYDVLDPAGPYEGRDRDHMFMTAFLQLMIDDDVRVDAVMVDRGWLEVDTCDDLAVYKGISPIGMHSTPSCNLASSNDEAVLEVGQGAQRSQSLRTVVDLRSVDHVLRRGRRVMASFRADHRCARPGEHGCSVRYLTSSEDDPVLSVHGWERGRSSSVKASSGRSCSRRWRWGVLVATVPQLGISVCPAHASPRSSVRSTSTCSTPWPART